MQYDISIVIVSWNVKELLKKCLDSILKNQDDLKLEIIVVDNASSDGTAEWLRARSTGLKALCQNENLGFAKANNIGIEKSQGKYILLLNPDTEILSGTLKKMYNFFEQNSSCGLASCRHLNSDSTLQPSVRRLPTFWSQFLILYKIHHLFPNLKTSKNYLAKDFDYNKTQTCQQIPGSFFMMRRDVIEKIGLLDENYFIWFEEVDYCKRALEKGFKIYYNAEAGIIHHGGRSFKQVLSTKKQKNFNLSMRYYFKKHHNKFAWLFISCASLESIILTWLISKIKK